MKLFEFLNYGFFSPELSVNVVLTDYKGAIPRELRCLLKGEDNKAKILAYNLRFADKEYSSNADHDFEEDIWERFSYTRKLDDDCKKELIQLFTKYPDAIQNAVSGEARARIVCDNKMYVSDIPYEYLNKHIVRIDTEKCFYSGWCGCDNDHLEKATGEITIILKDRIEED
jgi:hypothetical protein